jgi:23S rRNA pseudouridine1911/1915/1917 synthase
MRVVVSVPPEGAGERLDRFVAGLAEVGSRGAAERLLAEGRVLVDGAAQPKSRRLAGGEELALELPEAVAVEAAEELPEVAIPYADEHLLVVDKPAGLAVHPGAGRQSGTLVDVLAAHGAAGGDPERPGIVHRLDRETSGLLVVARSQEAYTALARLVRAHGLTREYLALVRGLPKSRRGTVDAPIGRDRRDPLRRSLDSEAPKDAVTHFEVEEILAEHTLLRVRLETGRTHQIRVHLAAIDLPVAGDPLYGVRRDLGLRRQFLHAARLAFGHPVTGSEVDVSSPLPDDLAAALTRARG